MIIRQMIEEDIPQLDQLFRQFWGEESCIETMNKQFNKLHKKDSHIFISAIENTKLVGSVMGVICEELYGDCKPLLVLENSTMWLSFTRERLGKGT